MKTIYRILFCIVALAGAYPCAAQTDSLKHLHLLPPCCSDRGTPLPQDSSLTVVEGAALMWESEFAYHYGNQAHHFDRDSTSLIPDIPSFKVPMKTLRRYINSTPSCKGIKAYFGLENRIDVMSHVPDSLCLILVPYDTNGDRPFPCPIGPSVKINRLGVTEGIQTCMAQSYIDNWRQHYNIEPSYVLRVYGYSLSQKTLDSQVVNARSSDSDSTVYIRFGLHTVMPCDTGYCFVDSNGGCASDTLYGFAVVNLILATKNNGNFLRSSDFLRPCPRFCGQSLFCLYCNEDEWEKR